jgi:hypothetical protein
VEIVTVRRKSCASTPQEGATLRDFNTWLVEVDPVRLATFRPPFDPVWHFWRDRGDHASFNFYRTLSLIEAIEQFHAHIEENKPAPISAEIFPLLYNEPLNRESAKRAIEYLEKRLEITRRGLYAQSRQASWSSGTPQLFLAGMKSTFTSARLVLHRLPFRRLKTQTYTNVEPPPVSVDSPTDR